MSEVADLYVLLRAMPAQFIEGMGKAGVAAEATDAKIASVSRTSRTMGMAIPAAIALAVGASLKLSAEFDRSMTQIQTLAHVPASSLKELSAGILNVAGTVGFSPNSLAEALYHVESTFASTGINSQKALDILTTAAKAAQIGGADLTDVVNALDAAVVSGIPGVENMQQAVGALLATVGSGDMTMQNLADALGSGILAIVKQYGVTLADVGASLATFGDNNIRGAKAATDLRMAIMDLAAQSDKGAAVLKDKLGLAVGQLGKDMREGGLNKALLDLNDHLKAAGYTGTKVGSVLIDAFTKKSSAPLSILLGELDQFESKYPELAKGAHSFGQQWADTANLLSTKMQEAKANIETAFIGLGHALQPVAKEILDEFNKVFDWARANLPQIAHALEPLAHIVGSVILEAWKALAGVMKVAFTVLSSIGSWIGDHQTLFTTLATVIGSIWLAFKMYTIAKVALTAISSAMETFALRAMYAGEAVTTLSFRTATAGRAMAAFSGAMAGVGIGMLTRDSSTATKAVGALGSTAMGAAAGFAAGGPIGAAIGAGAGLIGDLATAFGGADAATKQWQSDVQSLTQAIMANNGVLNDTARLAMARAIQDQGLFTIADKLSISYRTMTSAALGNKDAMEQVKTAMLGAAGAEKLTGADAMNLLKTLNNANQSTKDAVLKGHQLADAMEKSASSTRDNANAAQAAAQAAREQAKAVAELRKSLQDLINTELDQMGTLDSFKEGLLQLKKQVKDNGDSLSQNTLKGLANRDMLIGLLQNAEKAAEGSKNYGKALRNNVQDFEAAAKAAGYHKAALKGLLDQANLLPKQIAMHLHVDGVGGVVDSLSAVAADADAAGYQAGVNFSNAFKRANGIASPSKVFRYYGKMIIEGLVQGIRDSTQLSKDAAQSLAEDLVSKLNAIRGAIHGTANDAKKAFNALLRDAQKAGVPSDELDRLGNAEDRLVGKMRERAKVADQLSKAQSQLQRVQQAYRNTLQSVRSAVSGTFDIGSVQGQTDAVTGAQLAPTSADIVASVTTAVNNARSFYRDLKELQQRGLPRGLLSQLAQAGPSALPQAEALLGASKSDFLAIKSSYVALNNIAQQTGKFMANTMHGAGVDAARGLVKGLESERSHLTHVIENIGLHILKVLRKTLKISSPSQMTHDIGKNVGLGLVYGMMGQKGALELASKSLANSSTKHLPLGSGRVPGGAGGTHYHITVQGSVVDSNGLFRALQNAVQQHGGRNPNNGLVFSR